MKYTNFCILIVLITIRMNLVKMVNLLLDAGADVNIQAKTGTPLEVTTKESESYKVCHLILILI